MYDTHVTIVGNVLAAPELRRTKNTGSLVAHFKVASTARRLDRETGHWVDGNSFRVRVNCWRKLAEGVKACLVTGDPVIVVGRLYTRDWTDENDNHRIGYELEAIAVGHDLSRGQGTFTRNRPALSTSAIEDEPGQVHIGGEPTEPVEPAPATEAGDELLGADDDLGATDDLAARLGLGLAEADDGEQDSAPDAGDRSERGRRRGRTAVTV
jgi:single-strand DNA-binding protein